MKEYDRKTFIADSAKAFAERRITSASPARLGIAGLGLSGSPPPCWAGPGPSRA